MLNPATEKLVINSFMASYTMLYAQHNFYLDDDVVSKVAFYKSGSQELTAFFPATEKLYTYFTLKNLTSNSLYTLNAAFYDQMADDVSLVNAKIGINLSDTLTFTTAKTPTFSGIEVVATSVDVGVSDPTVVFSLDGAGQTVVIQAQKVGSTDWLTVFDGAFSSKISVIVPVGDYKFRIAGRIQLPDGVSLDISPWYQYPLTISVTYLAIPPTTPTNLIFKAAKIKDGVERYDVQVSWTWDRGSGAQVKEFILQYVTSEEYAKTGWSKASVINNSTAKSVVLSAFPYNKQYTFRVGVTSWGQTTVWSSNASFIIDGNTVFDQTITTVSSCEIGYYGIRAYVLDAGTYKQSFLVDAATGAVSIGTLDSNGKAPFVFDPVNKILNIDGKVIANDINAANFILTNTGTGSAPKLYSQEKPYYGSANSGIFIGRNQNGLMQLDIGNSASYMRFDGSNLRIAGQVVIGTASGDLPLENAIQGKNVVFVYKTSSTAPATPTSTAYPPSGWSVTPATAPCWVSQGQLDPITGALVSGTYWSSPIKFSGDTGPQGNTGPQGVPGVPGANGITTYTWIKYADSSTGSGISNDPTGKTYIGFAYNKTTATESNTPSDYTWSLIKGTDGVPGAPGANGVTTYTWIKYSDNADGTGLYDIPTTNTKYIGIAVNKLTATESADKTDYTWSLFKGADGANGANGINGSRGAGMYAYAISGFSSWSDSYATTFFNNNFGSGPIKYDVLTQYNTTTPSIAVTKMWDGSVWTTPSLVVHGDQIVDGTVRARALVADNAFLAKAGIDIIYDKTAALSSNPESSYKMKIDLANGFLHIR